jgi:hypothetical protein
MRPFHRFVSLSYYACSDRWRSSHSRPCPRPRRFGRQRSISWILRSISATRPGTGALSAVLNSHAVAEGILGLCAWSDRGNLGARQKQSPAQLISCVRDCSSYLLLLNNALPMMFCNVIVVSHLRAPQSGESVGGGTNYLQGSSMIKRHGCITNTDSCYCNSNVSQRGDGARPCSFMV